MHEVFLLSPWVDIRYKMTITSLALLKYYLEDHGHAARIIDCAYHRQDLADVLPVIAASPRPIVGVTAYTRERFGAYDLIRRVRAAVPDAVIVVGGRHFGFLAQETLAEMPEVDVVVRGEGEVTLLRLVEAVKAGRTLEGVEGLSYRTPEGQVEHNPDRPQEDDLDQFRSYDVHGKSDLKPENLLGHTKLDGSHRYFSVHATRGCPNRCVYCSLRSSKVRYRSIASVIQEIEDKIAATGVRHVSFTDSSLTISRRYVTDLCNAIIEKKLNIVWRCYSRVNIDVKILELMRRAGLDAVEIGLETGSPKVLKAICKNIKHDEVERFCHEAHRLGIQVWVFCMVSLPEETYEDALMTVEFLRKITPYITSSGLQTTRVTPDATLHQMARERGILPADFSWFEPYETPHQELTRPWDASLPLYLENLTIPQIQDIHSQFDALVTTRLATFNSLLQGLRYNLSRKGLARLTPASLARKVKKAALMLVNATLRKAK